MDIERLESESRVFQVIRKGSKEPVYYYRDPSFELGVDDSLVRGSDLLPSLGSPPVRPRRSPAPAREHCRRRRTHC